MSTKQVNKLTQEQKIKAGYEAVGLVAGNPVNLTPSDLVRIRRGVSNREQLIAYKIEQATKALEGSAESNAPMEFQFTPGGNIQTKQSGTRSWVTMSPQKVLEFLSHAKTLKAMCAAPQARKAASFEPSDEE